MKRLKKILCFILAVLTVVSSIYCIPEIDSYAATPSVVITSPTSKSIYAVSRGASNKLFTIKYKVKGGTEQSVSFSSSDSSVAAINKKTGKVCVRSAGVAKITVSVVLTSGQTVKDTLQLKVTQKVTSITATLKNSTKYKNYYYITKGNKKTITVAVKPTSAANRSVTFTSSKPSVAKVSSKGVITALKAGTTKITVKAKDGSGKSCSFMLKVVNKTPNALESALTGRTYTGKGNSIVKYAKKYIGTPYVYGGTSLKAGVDCSGFTMKVYAHYGYTLYRVASMQVKNGTEIDLVDLQPGDLVFFDFDFNGVIDHVGIYSGDFTIVHASTTGVKEAYMKYLPFPVKAVRVLK